MQEAGMLGFVSSCSALLILPPACLLPDALLFTGLGSHLSLVNSLIMVQSQLISPKEHHSQDTLLFLWGSSP